MFIKQKIKRSVPLEQIVQIMNDRTPLPTTVDLSFAQKVSQIVQEEISINQNAHLNNTNSADAKKRRG